MADELKHKDVGPTLTENEWKDVDTHILDGQATGSMIYALSAAQLSRLGIGSAGQLLGIAGGIPVWETYAGTSSIVTVGTVTTGEWTATALAPTYGGTGQTTWTTGQILYANGANTIAKLTVGSASQQLRVSAGGIPEWFTPTASGATVGLAVALAIVF